MVEPIYCLKPAWCGRHLAGLRPETGLTVRYGATAFKAVGYHSTVCYGIQRIKSLRESNPEVDAAVTQLKQQLARDGAHTQIESDCRESDFGSPGMTLEEVADRIAQRIWMYLEERLKHPY